MSHDVIPINFGGMMICIFGTSRFGRHAFVATFHENLALLRGVSSPNPSMETANMNLNRR